MLVEEQCPGAWINSSCVAAQQPEQRRHSAQKNDKIEGSMNLRVMSITCLFRRENPGVLREDLRGGRSPGTLTWDDVVVAPSYLGGGVCGKPAVC